MEKPTKNKIEDKEDIEKFPTKEEVIAFVESIPGIRNPKIVKELFDEKGIYLLNLITDVDNLGETVLCEYVRKRTSGIDSKDDRIGSIATKLDLVYYQNGQIYDGVEYAEYNEEIGGWKIKE